MLSGLVFRSILSIIAGYFLAKKSLAPIKESIKQQKQFVSDASHELRTPLSIIQSRVELLLKHPYKKIEEKVDSISVVLNECRGMAKLLNDMLILAKSDSNKLAIEKGEFSLKKLLTEIVDSYSEIVKQVIGKYNKII
ncbi:His kinase A [Gottschalkia purinilytica]|uniref:histidine kinase n=1 Tax=Gottschalkia purinilytica TaxID=1503 RepID=A0A0L0W6E8_GOTPU|nr:histidine kinase dimerization/phospho-acceptor domain-containing protein [Gottschalkia purinilytica]KNF07052.1 His kinase A [Gottschalkia purinilytica]